MRRLNDEDREFEKDPDYQKLAGQLPEEVKEIIARAYFPPRAAENKSWYHGMKEVSGWGKVYIDIWTQTTMDRKRMDITVFYKNNNDKNKIKKLLGEKAVVGEDKDYLKASYYPYDLGS